MCDHCHRSCCYCGPCYPRRCVSCTAICRCEPCSTASCCCHCCWTTCPCCCRRTCRSHSLGGVPFKQSSDDNEIKLKKISGYYLKMQNKSISDLYKNTSPTSKSSRMRGRRGERQSEEHHKQTICKSHDHLRHLMETPIFSPRLLAALEECAPIEACDSYADFVGVPFTYYPKFVIAGYYPPTCKKSAHGEHLDALKLRLLSRKNIGSCERRDLFDKNLLNDFNKLYATVGGGMVQTEMGTLEPMPTQMLQQQQEITTPHAIEEYRAFFGSRRHKRRGHSRTSKPRRLSPQRKRFSARRMRGISGQNSEVIRSENYLVETDSFQAQYQPQLGSTDGNVSSQRPSQQRDFSDANGSSEVLRSEFDHNETDGSSSSTIYMTPMDLLVHSTSSEILMIPMDLLVHSTSSMILILLMDLLLHIISRVMILIDLTLMIAIDLHVHNTNRLILMIVIDLHVHNTNRLILMIAIDLHIHNTNRLILMIAIDLHNHNTNRLILMMAKDLLVVYRSNLGSDLRIHSTINLVLRNPKGQ